MSLVGTRPPTVDEWEKYEMHVCPENVHVIKTTLDEIRKIANEKFGFVILWSAKKYSIIEKRTYVLLKMLGGAANAGADTQLCSN